MENYAEKIAQATSMDEAEAIKHHLFLENVRIQAEKAELEKELNELKRERKSILEDRKRLQNEKNQLTVEMSSLKEEVQFERKRLRDEQKLYEQHEKMIQHAYEMLDKDKQYIQEEKLRNEKDRQTILRMQGNLRKENYATGLFFRGVNNEVALKKRYKELMKIFHPDNLCGDQEILLKIKEEYEELRRKLGYAM